MQKRWPALLLAVAMLTLCLASAAASSAQIDETITINATVGDSIYREIYRDAVTSERTFLATRDGGSYPDWEEFVFSTDQPYSGQGEPRVAWLSLTAKVAGDWSFRVGVFEAPEMGKTNARLYTVQVNLHIKPATGNNTGSLGTGYVLCESLSVRMEPNTASQTIAGFAHGLTFDITQVQDDWMKVNCDGTIGWVNAQYVLRDPNYYTATTETAAYAYPAPESKRVGLLDPGTKLAIIAELEDYYVVSMRGASAFIRK